MKTTTLTPTQKRSSTRKAAATAGVAAVLTLMGTGVAQAAQSADLGPNQGRSFATWFWGRTTVCVQNQATNRGASFNWTSGTSYGYRALAPGEEYCLTRSFAGVRVYVQNTTWDASLGVRFPIGP